MHIKEKKKKVKAETQHHKASYVKSSMAWDANPDKFIFWYSSISLLEQVCGGLFFILL